MDNSDFYNFIVNIGKESANISDDIRTIENIVLANYKENIMLAATATMDKNSKPCKRKAVLCIYEVGAKYNNKIDMDKYIRPTDEFATILEQQGITPLIDTFREKVKPFRLCVKVYRVEGKNKEFVSISVHW